jgi:hypothetical protein
MQELMKYICRFVSFGLIFFSVACQASAPPAASASEGVDFKGDRFRCDDPSWVSICLRVLRDDCSLSIAPGRGLPREPQDKLVLIRGNQARIVTGPADLVGCVEITSEQDALEYLQFFSSYALVYLFSEQELEIYKGGCFAVCLSDEQWHNSELGEISVLSRAGSYEVTRYVIKPAAIIPEVQLYRITQRVGGDGVVVTLNSESVPLPLEHRLRLSFPRFL